MIFTEDHITILREVSSGFSGVRPLADKVCLPEALTSHLLNELCEGRFIKCARGFNYTSGHLEIVKTCLTDQGNAAIESPNHFLNKPMSSQGGTAINGDYVQGDKVIGDKIAGDKTVTQNNFNGPMSGIIGSTFNDNAQVSNNTFTQTNNPTPNELLQLITTLRQTASQFSPDLQNDLIIDIDDIETELQKPDDQRSLPKLKKRLGALIAAVSIAATPIAATTDFTNTTLDLADKLNIELPRP